MGRSGARDKGQEILTADKVAIRVTIITNYKVVDPRAAVTRVESFADRVYSDVQLAARRSLASMTLEEILTNRNQLSDDILHDVAEGAADYGIAIRRAHVKDLVFPGNLQEIMNRVLATERLSEAERVEANTKAATSTATCARSAPPVPDGSPSPSTPPDNRSNLVPDRSNSTSRRPCWPGTLGWC